MVSRTLSRWLMSLALAVFALATINLLVAKPSTLARHAPALINCSGPIQACIDAANDGDTVLIAAGRYTESLTLSKAVSLTGVSSETTIIHAVAGQRVLTVTGATIGSSVVISGLTFTGGNVISVTGTCPGPCGGSIALLDSAMPIIHSSIIIDNQARVGGGVYATSELLMVNAIITDNYASDRGGGIYVQGSSLTLVDTSVIGNRNPYYDGGGANAYGPVAITRGRFENNVAGTGGGLFSFGPVTLTNTEFLGNSAYSGGGIFANANSVTAFDSRFENNTATYGGGISVGRIYFGISHRVDAADRISMQQHNAALTSDVAAVFLSNTVFISNAALPAHGYGGGVAAPNATVIGGRFERNTNGGLHTEDGGLLTSSLIDTLFISNTGHGATTLNQHTLVDSVSFIDNQGGGLYSLTADVTGTRFLNNSAYSGGGMYSVGFTAITNSVFESNTATHDGGGLLVSGRGFSIKTTKFVNNSADRGGAACHDLYLTGYSGLIANSLLAGNIASTSGAGLYLNTANVDTILNTTIVNPVSSTAEAILVTAGTVNVTNTILSGYSAGIARNGGFVSEDYNLFYGNVTNTVGVITDGEHSLIGDPKFVDPLNGDYHLQFSSAAIDHGINAGVYTDLDGNPRPTGAGFDIGAYEYKGAHYLWLPFIRKGEAFAR